MNVVRKIQSAVTVFSAAVVSFAFLAEAAPAGGARTSGADASGTNAVVYIGTNTNTNVVAVLKVKKGDVTYRPLAEARAMIGEIISDPSKMVEVMQSLSPEDQKTFVADVNAAIEKLPGSTEYKAAKFLNINKEALKGAAEGNMGNILAETFASVPPEALAVISEVYANDLFNRDSAAENKMSNSAYEKTALEVVGKVEVATTGSDDAGVRNTLAILMFVKADNGQTEGLTDRLVDTLPDAATRDLAVKEWIPAAMAEGDQKSYDEMLAYADAGKAPNLNVVLNLAGPQILDAMLMDITSGMDDGNGNQTTPALDTAFGIGDTDFPVLNDTSGLNNGSAGANAKPRTTDPTKPWNPAYNRGNADKYKESPIPEPPEPKPYPYTGM